MRWVYLARYVAVDPALYIKELDDIGFDDKQRAFIVSWIRHEINLVRKALPEKKGKANKKKLKLTRKTPIRSKKK